MQISHEINDQLMCTAAHRYCLGRRSYIVGACIEWLNAHWSQFTDQTKLVILRDTLIAIKYDKAGANIDKKEWINFVSIVYSTLSEELKASLSNNVDIAECLTSNETINNGQF